MGCCFVCKYSTKHHSIRLKCSAWRFFIIWCRLNSRSVWWWRCLLSTCVLSQRLWSHDLMALYKSVYYYYFLPSVDIFPREFKNWDIQNWVQIYQSVQSGVGKLSCNKTALKRCTSTETVWNRTAPSLSSPEDEEIFLPKLPKSWHADVFKGAKVSTAIGTKIDTERNYVTVTLCIQICLLLLFFIPQVVKIPGVKK